MMKRICYVAMMAAAMIQTATATTPTKRLTLDIGRPENTFVLGPISRGATEYIDAALYVRGVAYPTNDLSGYLWYSESNTSTAGVQIANVTADTVNGHVYFQMTTSQTLGLSALSSAYPMTNYCSIVLTNASGTQKFAWDVGKLILRWDAATAGAGVAVLTHSAQPSYFTALTDTPSSYVGQAGKVATVNSNETALEFTAAGAGDITGVTAGTWLTGGGASGNVTLNTDTNAVMAAVTGKGYLTAETDPIWAAASNAVPYKSAYNVFAVSNRFDGDIHIGNAGYIGQYQDDIVIVTTNGSLAMSIQAAGPRNLNGDWRVDQAASSGLQVVNYRTATNLIAATLDLAGTRAMTGDNVTLAQNVKSREATSVGDFGAAFGIGTVAGESGAAFGDNSTSGDYGGAFGYETAAGDYGLAAGRQAKGGPGSFVFADNTAANFVRTDLTNWFSVRANGGAIFHTPTFAVTGGVTAASFSGDGASLTALNATQLTSGTIPAARYGAGAGTTNAITSAGLIDISSLLGGGGGADGGATNITAGSSDSYDFATRSMTWNTNAAAVGSGGGGFDSNTLAVVQIGTAQTVTAGSTSTIQYTFEVADHGNNYNTNTFTYITPSDGHYYAYASTRDNSARTVDRVIMTLAMGAASVALYDCDTDNAGSYMSPSVTGVAYCTNGTSIRVTYNPTTVNSALSTGTRSTLIVYKLE